MKLQLNVEALGLTNTGRCVEEQSFNVKKLLEIAKITEEDLAEEIKYAGLHPQYYKSSVTLLASRILEAMLVVTHYNTYEMK